MDGARRNSRNTGQVTQVYRKAAPSVQSASQADLSRDSYTM